MADFGTSDHTTPASEPAGLSLRALNEEIAVIESEIGMMCAAWGVELSALDRSEIDAAEAAIVDAEELARIFHNWAATGEQS
jgi:hypothetical protein